MSGEATQPGVYKGGRNRPSDLDLPSKGVVPDTDIDDSSDLRADPISQNPLGDRFDFHRPTIIETTPAPIKMDLEEDRMILPMRAYFLLNIADLNDAGWRNLLDDVVCTLEFRDLEDFLRNKHNITENFGNFISALLTQGIITLNKSDEEKSLGHFLDAARFNLIVGFVLGLPSNFKRQIFQNLTVSLKKAGLQELDFYRVVGELNEQRLQPILFETHLTVDHPISDIIDWQPPFPQRVYVGRTPNEFSSVHLKMKMENLAEFSFSQWLNATTHYLNDSPVPVRVIVDLQGQASERAVHLLVQSFSWQLFPTNLGGLEIHYEKDGKKYEMKYSAIQENLDDGYRVIPHPHFTLHSVEDFVEVLSSLKRGRMDKKTEFPLFDEWMRESRLAQPKDGRALSRAEMNDRYVYFYDRYEIEKNKHEKLMENSAPEWPWWFNEHRTKVSFDFPNLVSNSKLYDAVSRLGLATYSFHSVADKKLESGRRKRFELAPRGFSNEKSYSGIGPRFSRMGRIV